MSKHPEKKVTKKDIAKGCAERVLHHIENIKVINPTPILDNPDGYKVGESHTHSGGNHAE